MRIWVPRTFETRGVQVHALSKNWQRHARSGRPRDPARRGYSSAVCAVLARARTVTCPRIFVTAAKMSSSAGWAMVTVSQQVVRSARREILMRVIFRYPSGPG